MARRKYSRGSKIQAGRIGRKQSRRAKRNPKVKKPTKKEYWSWVRGGEILDFGEVKASRTRREKRIRKAKTKRKK